MFDKKKLENKIKELEEENKKIKESYGLSKSKELKEEIAIYREEQEKFKKIIDEKNEEIRDLKNNLEKAQNANSKIDTDLDFYKSQYTKLQSENQKLQSDYNELFDNFNIANQEIEKLNQEIAVKDLEIIAYKQAISNISLTFQKGETNDKPKLKKESKGE